MTDKLIKTLGYDQHNMLREIIDLHCGGAICVDPTFSKGAFYKSGVVPMPRMKFDLFPKTEDTIQASAENLPLENSSINTIVFDPPFVAGHTKSKPTGIIGERFHGFRYMADVWEWYEKCLQEFHRILQPSGKVVFKCQDTVSSGKQHWSHVHIINKGEDFGFYCKDLFVLGAKSRIIGHNHKVQKHGRKFHSYFLVLEKTK